MDMKNKTAYRKKPGFSKPDMDRNTGRDKTGVSLSSSGGVVSPLAGRRSPTDEFLELGVVLFGRFCSFNQLTFMSGIQCIRHIGTATCACFFIFCDVRKQGVFLGLHSNGLRLDFGTFVKRRSSLGRFSSRSVALP